MNFTPPQLKIIAFSAAAARLTHPMWFNVLQRLLQNRSLQQEMKHEEEVRSRSVGPRILGRHPVSTAMMIRLLLGLLPEQMRMALWHALRVRYAVDNPKVEPDDDVVIAPTG